MGAKHQHQRAESSLGHYEFLLEALELVHAHRDLASLLPALASRLRRVVKFDYVHIAFYDSARNVMRLHLLEARLPVRAETGDELPVEECPQGLVWQTQQVFIISDIERETRFPQFVERLRESGVRSYYVLPLTSVGKPLGAITFASRDESAWSESDLNYLKYVAKAIAITVDNALLFRQVEEQRDKLAQEKICLEEEIRDIHNFADFIGGSPSLKRVFKQIEIVAPTDSTVLLQGETGTGKELVARAIHNLSPRRERTIMKVDCAAMPTELLQSELFGHERGAFTGAFARRIGRFELADKGTLFLDEIGDLPLGLHTT